MPNDFKPEVGHRFAFRSQPQPGWTGVTNCEVKIVEPLRRLVCTWGDGSETDSGLKTVVTWILTPEAGGTRVRMEQSGFRPQDEAAHRGAGYGWRRLVAGLERVAGELLGLARFNDARMSAWPGVRRAQAGGLAVSVTLDAAAARSVSILCANDTITCASSPATRRLASAAVNHPRRRSSRSSQNLSTRWTSSA